MDRSLFTFVLWDPDFSRVILGFWDVYPELWRVFKQGSDFSGWRHFIFANPAVSCRRLDSSVNRTSAVLRIGDVIGGGHRDVAAMWRLGGVTSSNPRDCCGTKDCLDEETASILRLWEVSKVRISLRGLLGLDSSLGSVFYVCWTTLDDSFKREVDPEI